jgi:AcrR family transcriptional regulator
MSTRIPRQARSKATVEAIIGGTARVLASRGYAKATTNHIAEAAGVSIGSFYQYFADKDAAVSACAEQFASESLAFAWEHVDDGGSSPIGAWLDAVMDRATDQETLVRVLFQEVPYTWSLPGVRDAMAAAVAVIERLGGPAVAGNPDRAYVILRSAVAVTTDAVANPDLKKRRKGIVAELTRMIEAYLSEPDEPVVD